MNIRKATTIDSEKIAMLHIESWQNTYRGIVTDSFLDGLGTDERRACWQKRFENPSGNQFVLVAEDQGILLGFICLLLNSHFLI